MASYTIAQSGGDYSTFAAFAAAASAGDDATMTGTWSSADTTAVSITDDNITVTADSDSKHPGYWDTSVNHYRLSVSTATALTISGAYTVTISNIAIAQAGSGTSDEVIRAVPGTSDTITIQNCLLQCTGNYSQQDIIYTGNDTSIGTIDVIQCFLWGAGRTGIHAQNNNSGNNNSGIINVNSCLIWNCGRYSSGAVGGIGVSGFDNKHWQNFDINVHNSIVVENDTGTGTYLADFAESYASSLSDPVWGISNTADSDNSIATVDGGGSGNFASRTATDNTSPGTGNWIILEDITNDPPDLRTVDNAENDAQDAHATATAEGITIPSTDITGTSRPDNTNYELGPFEITSGGTTQAIGLNTETDTALSQTVLKTSTLGLLTETDTAQPFTFAKAKTLGLLTETDTALPITALKTVTIGLNTETDEALFMLSGDTTLIGLTTETDTALPITALKTQTIGLATETDAALRVSGGDAAGTFATKQLSIGIH